MGLADRKQARRSAGETRARDKAAFTRRASITAGQLDPDTAPLAEVGLLLGTTTHDREPVVLTLEDQVGIIAATGAGKTLYLMIAAALDAPGPLIATSTKPEVLDAIVEARTDKGRVWVFDPLNVANWPEPMIWNPVTGAEQLHRRRRPREAFAGGLGGADSLSQLQPVLPVRRGDHHRPAAARRRPHRRNHGRGGVLGAGAGTVHHRPGHPRPPPRTRNCSGRRPSAPPARAPTTPCPPSG